MKCGWCKGTGDRAGYGECEHCGDTGEQPDPPFGGIRRMPDLWVSGDALNDVCEALFEINHSGVTYGRLVDAAMRVECIAMMTCGLKLPADEVQIFAEYWANPHCNDNYGEMINRVAERAMHHSLS